jgi:HPt (histidine-containing phosphotransfer) domain-containing protein
MSASREQTHDREPERARMSATDPFAAELARIAAKARRSNLARAEQLGHALDRARDGGLDGELRETARRLAHQLAGSSGTLGHPAAVQPARLLESFFTDGSDVDAASAAEALDRVVDALEP